LRRTKELYPPHPPVTATTPFKILPEFAARDASGRDKSLTDRRCRSFDTIDERAR
jgi:hypothetical protein